MSLEVEHAFTFLLQLKSNSNRVRSEFLEETTKTVAQRTCIVLQVDASEEHLFARTVRT